MLLIGSNALVMQGLLLEPKDTDFICTEEECLIYSEINELTFQKYIEGEKAIATGGSGHKYEFYFYEHGELNNSNPWYLLWLSASDHITNRKIINTVYGSLRIEYPSVQWLLAQKYTHRFKDSVHFEKTMRSIHYLENLGYSKVSHELLDKAEKLFLIRHPNLNVSAKEFFKESDGFYKYNHDDIHQAIVQGGNYSGIPAYKKIVKGEVQCCMDTFDKLSNGDKLACAVEEVMVLAIERGIIPYKEDIEKNTVVHPQQLLKAVEISLRKVCTRITSGRFRLYCWNNYYNILSVLKHRCFGYYNNFAVELLSGNVRKFKEE